MTFIHYFSFPLLLSSNIHRKSYANTFNFISFTNRQKKRIKSRFKTTISFFTHHIIFDYAADQCYLIGSIRKVTLVGIPYSVYTGSKNNIFCECFWKNRFYLLLVCRVHTQLIRKIKLKYWFLHIFSHFAWFRQ